MNNTTAALHSILPDSDAMASENVVIGSGPGGALTACLLAEAGREVLLIEEGPLLSQASCTHFSLEEMETKYRHGGITLAAGRPNVAYVEGRCVGGGSEINACLYHRTPQEILNAWREDYKVDSIGEGSLEEFFEANERELPVTALPGDSSPAAFKLREGASILGWKSIEVPHFFKYASLTASGVPVGTRRSMTETFLPRFIAAGGRLLANTQAARVKQRDRKGGWVVFAEFSNARRITINAQNVFIAAGAIQTPALLRQSGIKQNIGNSLRLHPTVKVVAEFPEMVNIRGMGVSLRQVKEFAPRYSFGCSVSSLPHLAAALVNYPGHLRAIEERWKNMAIYYVMIPGGMGTVRQPPFFSAPLVRYHVGREEMYALSEGLKLLCRLLLAAGAKALYPTLSGMPAIHTSSDIMSIPEPLPDTRSNLVTLHLMGTCPMGENAAKCAVDSFGKVHGMTGLFVNDASLLCTAVGVNPQGTIMAIARRNVIHFLNS